MLSYSHTASRYDYYVHPSNYYIHVFMNTNLVELDELRTAGPVEQCPQLGHHNLEAVHIPGHRVPVRVGHEGDQLGLKLQ